MTSPRSSTWDPRSDAWALTAFAVVVGAALLVLATGHVSALVAAHGVPQYRLVDAPHILAGVARRPSDPGRAWDAVNSGAATPGPILWWTTFGTLTLTGVLGGYRARGHSGRRSEPGGWATRSTRRALRPKRGEHRLVVGTATGSPVAVEHRHSVLVFGPTQSGKTSGLAIPAILEWPGAVVATSTKGDLVDNTIGWRATLGPVHVFDPAASTAYQSAGWSPLLGADSWDGAGRAAWDLAMAGKAAVGGTMSLADFWFSGAAKSLAPYLLAAAVTDRSISDVARWIDAEERAEVLSIVRHVEPDAVLALEATFRREERARSSLFQVMQQILVAYLDPVVAASADHCEIDVQALLHGPPSTLYVTSPHRDQARLRPIFATLIGQVVAAVYDQVARTQQPLDPPMLLVLDEAANIAPVEDLAALASTASAMGLQLVTVFQDLAQVKARYGAASGTVVNNHRATLLLPGIKDVETLQLSAQLGGDHEVDRESVTHGVDGRRSRTTASQWRQLLPADRTRTLPTGAGVLLYGNVPPLQVDLRPWFRDRRLRRRGRLACPGSLTTPSEPETRPSPADPTIEDLARARLRRRETDVA